MSEAVQGHLDDAKNAVVAAARDYTAEHLAETDTDEKLAALVNAIDALDSADETSEESPAGEPTEEA